MLQLLRKRSHIIYIQLHKYIYVVIHSSVLHRQIYVTTYGLVLHVQIHVTPKTCAGTIFIHPSASYFKIPQTDVQKSLPPVPYSHRLADVVPIWNPKSLSKVTLPRLPSLYAIRSFSATRRVQNWSLIYGCQRLDLQNYWEPNLWQQSVGSVGAKYFPGSSWYSTHLRWDTPDQWLCLKSLA